MLFKAVRRSRRFKIFILASKDEGFPIHRGQHAARSARDSSRLRSSPAADSAL